MKEKNKEVNEEKFTGFLDKDTEFMGDLTFRGSFRIDGHFKGTISSDSVLIIGDQGKVEAEVKVGTCIVNGEINGTLRGVQRIEVHSHGRVFGTIITPKLIVEEGAYLDAHCQSGEHVSLASEEKEGMPTS